MAKRITKLTLQFIVLIGFFIVLAGIILYARGYRLDINNKSVSPTGIIAVSSYPKAAQILINGELKGVTDSNITLPPGNYTVIVRKDGYNDWQKQVNLKGELVISLNASLFPKNPSLSPLTNLGIKKVVPVDLAERMIIFVDNGDDTKDGIYLIDVSKKAFSFFSSYQLLVKKSQLPPNTDLTAATVAFSPDNKQALFEFPTAKASVAYVVSLEDQNPQLLDATLSRSTLEEAWKQEKDKQIYKILETYPPEIQKIASDSFHIINFSPDDTKFLYQANNAVTLPTVINPPLIATNPTPQVRTLEKNGLYIYDKKEDRNYPITILSAEKINITDSASNDLPHVEWYPDSKHVVFTDGKKLQIVDYDGQNKQTFYSGPFVDSFFNVTSDGKIIILANLNPAENPSPDLYSLGIQ